MRKGEKERAVTGCGSYAIYSTAAKVRSQSHSAVICCLHIRYVVDLSWFACLGVGHRGAWEIIRSICGLDGQLCMARMGKKWMCKERMCKGRMGEISSAE